jgi:thiamine-phosphate pyrophosphorylase
VRPLPRLALVADIPSFGAPRLFDALTRILARVRGPSLMVIERDLPPGAGGSTDRDRLDRLIRWRALTAGAGAWLVVNRRADLGAAAGADGVQLPERGLPVAAVRQGFPELRVGRSCHDRAGLLEAWAQGAEWALLSPVAAPLSKPATLPPLGVGGVARCVGGIDLPVLGLGGVTAGLAAALVRAGAHGVAVAGGVLGADDPGQAGLELLRAIEEAEASI